MRIHIFKVIIKSVCLKFFGNIFTFCKFGKKISPLFKARFSCFVKCKKRNYLFSTVGRPFLSNSSIISRVISKTLARHSGLRLSQLSLRVW